MPNADAPLRLGEGITGLSSVQIGGRECRAKCEQFLPTGSFKDRGAAVLLSVLRAMGVSQVVEDSSGNAGCSIAAYASKANVSSHIVVPEAASPGKIQQIERFGGQVERVHGNRARASERAIALTEKRSFASHVWNPFFLQGTKTVAFELAEQLSWEVPDVIILPVGNGSLLLGLFLGFTELLSSGAILKLPQLVAVQSKHCSPLCDLYEGNSPSQTAFSPTLAEGIAVANPARGAQIVRAIQASKGCVLTVSEGKILEGQREALNQGYWIEPTSAVAWAGAKTLFAGRFDSSQSCVIILTGHGYKTSMR